MYSLENYYRICREALCRLQIPIGTAIIRENKRLKRRWGQCRYSADDGVYLIDINPALLDEQNPVSALKDTILHELLHTCPGCLNHGAKWKNYAARVNAAYGSHVKTTSTEEEKGVNDARNFAANTYRLRCLRCGTTIYKYRMCKVVKNPERFVCAKCGGKIVPINF